MKSKTKINFFLFEFLIENWPNEHSCNIMNCMIKNLKYQNINRQRSDLPFDLGIFAGALQTQVAANTKN